MNVRRTFPVLRYGLAIAVVAVATVLQFFVQPDGMMPLLFYYPAVLLCAWRLGRGPGFLSIAVSAFCITYWFLPPVHQVAIAAERDAFDLGMFAAVSSFMVWLIDRRQAVGARYRALFESSPIPICEEDFSGVKAAFDQLRAAGVRDFKAHFDAHPEEIARMEGLIRITDVNQRFVELFGLGDKAFAPRALPTYLDERANAVVRDSLVAFAAGKLDQTMEIPIRTPGGEPMDISLSLRVVPECRHTWSRVLASFSDVTARVRAEAVLRDEDRRKNEFLAVLSHELRNPLTPIRNSLYLLAHAAPGSDAARRALAIIERQVAQLTRLVEDLLDVTRIAQVIGNLLQNAAKFTGPGGRIDLSLDDEPDAGMAVIRVRDTGTGIAPELLPRLFTPFTQADRSLARSRGGLGLGLSLSRGLVELHGGTIEAKSDGMGKGTEVIVRLPRGAAVVDAWEDNGGDRSVRV